MTCELCRETARVGEFNFVCIFSCPSQRVDIVNYSTVVRDQWSEVKLGLHAALRRPIWVNTVYSDLNVGVRDEQSIRSNCSRKLLKISGKDYHKLRSPNTGKNVQFTHYSEATTVNMGERVTRVPDI